MRDFKMRLFFLCGLCLVEGFLQKSPLSNSKHLTSPHKITVSTPSTRSDQSSVASLVGEVGGILAEGLVETAEKVWDAVDRRLYEEGELKKDHFEEFGKLLMDIEDKFLKKISASPTSNYLESLSSITTQIFPNLPGNHTDDSDKDEVELDQSGIQIEVLSTNGSEIDEELVLEKDSKHAETTGLASKPGINLQRPAQVQKVFENLQQEAIKSYKEKEYSQEEESNESRAQKAKKIEEQLEHFMEKSNMSPKALTPEDRIELVEHFEVLEKCTKIGEISLDNSDISGQWSLIYSSTESIFKRALGKKRSLFFKISSPCQKIDTKAKTIENSGLLRIRFTPIQFLARQIGTFECLDQDMISTKLRLNVTFGRGSFGRFLKIFRKGTSEADVTYISKNWRICRSENVLLAFRKVQDTV